MTEKNFALCVIFFFVLMLFGRGMETKWGLGYYKSKEGLVARKIGLVEKDFILGQQQKISRPIANYF